MASCEEGILAVGACGAALMEESTSTTSSILGGLAEDCAESCVSACTTDVGLDSSGCGFTGDGDSTAVPGSPPPPQRCSVCGCVLQELRAPSSSSGSDAVGSSAATAVRGGAPGSGNGGLPEPGPCCFCTPCIARVMDPFRPVSGAEDILHLATNLEDLSTFHLDLPDLRQWRKEGCDIEVRMFRRRVFGSDEGAEHCSDLCQVWPAFFDLEANGHEVFTVKPPLRGHKRRDVPRSITASLRPGRNELEARVEDACAEELVLAVVRTMPLAPRDLAVRCVRRVGFEESLVRVRALLANAAGMAGAVECVGDERLRLRCPITLEQLSTLPARGELCRHLQCFDLEAYLVANYRTRAFNKRWRCPVCFLDLRPQDLRVDGFVERVLRETQGASEVLVSPDGSWRAVAAAEAEADDVEAGQRRRRRAGGACVVEEEESTEEGEEKGGPATEPPVVAPPAKKRRRPTAAVTPHQPPPPRASTARARRHRSRSRGARRKEEPRRRRTTGGGKRTHRQSSGVVGRARWWSPPPPPPRRRNGRGDGSSRPRFVGSRSSRWRSSRANVPAPRHAIDVDSDAPPEVVSDSASGEGGGPPRQTSVLGRRGLCDSGIGADDAGVDGIKCAGGGGSQYGGQCLTDVAIGLTDDSLAASDFIW